MTSRPDCRPSREGGRSPLWSAGSALGSRWASAGGVLYCSGMVMLPELPARPARVRQTLSPGRAYPRRWSGIAARLLRLGAIRRTRRAPPLRWREPRTGGGATAARDTVSKRRVITARSGCPPACSSSGCEQSLRSARRRAPGPPLCLLRNVTATAPRQVPGAARLMLPGPHGMDAPGCLPISHPHSEHVFSS
jgi:hypothetical protein